MQKLQNVAGLRHEKGDNRIDFKCCAIMGVGAMFRVLTLTHLRLLPQMNSLCVTAIRSADLGMSSMHIWCTKLVQRNRSQRISFSVHRVAQTSRRCTISHQPRNYELFKNGLYEPLSIECKSRLSKATTRTPVFLSRAVTVS